MARLNRWKKASWSPPIAFSRLRVELEMAEPGDFPSIPVGPRPAVCVDAVMTGKLPAGCSGVRNRAGVRQRAAWSLVLLTSLTQRLLWIDVLRILPLLPSHRRRLVLVDRFRFGDPYTHL